MRKYGELTGTDQVRDNSGQKPGRKERTTLAEPSQNEFKSSLKGIKKSSVEITEFVRPGQLQNSNKGSSFSANPKHKKLSI